jgi:threonine/homoserine efflux transporter RhtA
LALDYFQLVIDVVGLVVLLAFGFYAVKLLASFRTGMLEKGWTQVAVGAIILVLAQFLFLPAGITTSGVSSALTDVGMGMRFLGVVFLTLGFRAHYKIWRPSKEVAAATSSKDIAQ